MNFELHLKQTQKMILTYELKQSLKILQMNTFQLQEYVTKEVEENPVLDFQSKEDIDWESYIRDIRKNKYIKNESEDPYNSDYNPENFIAETVTLYEHIQKELSMIDFTEEERRLAEDMVMQLDEDGYFRIDMEEYCNERKISSDEFEKILQKIQTMEPIGLGARNLEECLLLQAKYKGYADCILEDMIRHHLQWVGDRKFLELEKKYRITSEKLADYIDIIRMLEPKPGRRFSASEVNYITPDVFVEKNGDDIDVFFNEYTVPSIYVSKLFARELLQGTDENAKEYIRDRLNKANGLIRNIEQRKRTILKIAGEIVSCQLSFFSSANGLIRPLLMKDIADRTGFHESTVSRTVNGKYMMTPKGLYEFKFFFSGKLEGTDGTAHSNINIKQEIQKLISQEDKLSPHSDQKIANCLKEQGVCVSRRTVAKYREEMGIPSSAKRKELRR